MDEFRDEISGVGPVQEETEQNYQDLPPEYCQYKDEGCEYAGSCLHCPFARCIHDEPGGKRRWLKKIRDKEISRLYRKGHNPWELMSMFDVSERTVKRAINNNIPEYQNKGRVQMPKNR